MRKIAAITMIMSLIVLSGCINKPKVDPNLDIIPEARVETDTEASAKLEAELEDTLDEIDAMEKELDELDLETEETVESNETGITKIDEEWSLYTDIQGGYSIKVPVGTTQAKAGSLFTIYSVSSDAELAAVIKKEFGTTCEAGERKTVTEVFNGTTKPNVEGVYDIQLANVTNAEGGCFVNYVAVIKYSPSAQNAAIWKIGQDRVFVPADEAKPYEIDISASFKFI